MMCNTITQFLHATPRASESISISISVRLPTRHPLVLRVVIIEVMVVQFSTEFFIRVVSTYEIVQSTQSSRNARLDCHAILR
jgi:hypothetical protein